MSFFPQSRNIWIFSLCQGLLLTGTSLAALISSLVGYDLAPSPSLSTLPLTMFVIGNAVMIVPVIWILKSLGRKRGSLIGISAALSHGMLAILGLVWHAFWIYTVAHFLLGISVAFVSQYRFGAAQSVAPDQVPRAVSFILLGSIFAALLGPQLAELGAGFSTLSPYIGAYVLVMILFVFAGALLMWLVPIEGETYADSSLTARPLLQIISHPTYRLALATALMSYAMMTFLMTATPICMHKLSGFSLTKTKWVIQSHILAMFLPSLFTGHLIKKLGVDVVIFTGILVYGLCVLVGLLPASFHAYWLGLVFLGLGWNFLYVSATVLLTQSYRKSEQFFAQGFHDFVVFSGLAFASLFSGVIVHYVSWQVLNLTCGAVVLVFFIALLLHLNIYKKTKIQDINAV